MEAKAVPYDLCRSMTKHRHTLTKIISTGGTMDFTLVFGNKYMNSDNIERSVMEARLNKELHTLLLRTRDRMGFTQAQMANRYAMAKNTYSDLEAEKHGFGTLTAVLLLRDQEDPQKALEELDSKLQTELAEVTILI